MTDRRKVKQLVKIWVAIGAMSLIIGYGAFRAKDFVRGPELAVLSPFDGQLVRSSVVEIEGTAQNISFLTLNDGKIFTDESGKFKERILLSRGYNVMTVEAKDRFGRKVTKTLQLIYK